MTPSLQRIKMTLSYTAKDIQQLERVQRRAARFVKKDYRRTTSVTGLLDELGWLPLFERRKHSRLQTRF